MRHMMALFAFCCQAAYAQSPSASTPVRVLLTGDTSPAAVLQALQHAAESALAPSGLGRLGGRPSAGGRSGRSTAPCPSARTL
jgi:hypothetical protein